MVDKTITVKEAMKHIHSGDVVLIGGFGFSGQPDSLLKALAEEPIYELTAVSEGLAYLMTAGEFKAYPELMLNGQIKHIIVSFLGGDPQLQALIDSGDLTFELVPQGTMAERMRAAGAGIGGFYVKTGVGTIVEEGKEKRVIDGEEYLFEKPLPGDVALIRAHKADQYGNCLFRYTGNNFCLPMAMAGKTVIVEADEVVEPGDIEPDAVHIPGVLVDYVVQSTWDMYTK